MHSQYAVPAMPERRADLRSLSFIETPSLCSSCPSLVQRNRNGRCPVIVCEKRSAEAFDAFSLRSFERGRGQGKSEGKVRSPSFHVPLSGLGGSGDKPHSDITTSEAETVYSFFFPAVLLLHHCSGHDASYACADSQCKRILYSWTVRCKDGTCILCKKLGFTGIPHDIDKHR